MNPGWQILSGDGNGRRRSFALVNDDIEHGSAAAPETQSAGHGILAVNHTYESLRLGLVDREHVLKPLAATLIAILHEHAILLILLQVHVANWIAQVSIEGVDAMAVIIELIHPIPLLIEHHEIG